MSKTTKIIIGIIVVVIIIGGLWYLVSRPQMASENIKIGAILPLSGSNAFIGEYMRDGLEIAKDRINSNGGINGKKIEIIYDDSKADVTTGISAFNNLKDVSGIKFFLTTLSGVTLGIAPIAEKDQKILMNIGSTSPKISEAGDFIFRHSLLPEDEMKKLSDYLYEHYKEIGLVYVNAEAGVGYRDLFLKNFGEKGGKVIAEESNTQGQTDFRTILTKLKAKNPKAVLLLSYRNEVGEMLKEGKELGFSSDWFGVSDVEGQQLIDIAGETANDLIYSHYFSLSGSSYQNLKQYQDEFLKKYNKPADAYSALSYDTLYLLTVAIQKCKDQNNTTCVKDELYKIKDYSGITGLISFNANGDTEKAIILKTVKNGQFVPYEE